MLRVAHIGDNHFNRRNRWEECLRVHSWIAEDIARRDVDLVLLGGDLFERAPTHEETLAAALWIQSMAATAEVVGIYGNHDTPGCLDVMNRLDTRRRVTIYDRPAVHLSAVGVAVACLPWPRRARLLAALGADYGHEQVENVAQEALRDVLRGLGASLDAEGVGVARFGLCHVMIDGARTDHDQPMVGVDMALSLADLGLMRCDYVACSHVHARQVFTWNGVEIAFAGAPYHCNYGEPSDKGYVVATVDDDGKVSSEWIKTPCQPMVLIETEWNEEAGHLDCHDVPWEVESADVRFRFSVTSDQREPANAAAEDMRRILLEGGAERVTLDPVVRPVTRARAPEITEARTLPDKMRLLWRVRGEQLGAAREERVIGKLATLDEENAA